MGTGTAPSVTLSVTIDAPYDVAFDYLSEGRHVVEWATNFVFAVNEVGGGLVATTPLGDLPFHLEADRETGLLDQVMGQERFPARLVRNGEGVDYLFTLRKPPGMPDAAWEREGIPGMREELDNLKRILESGR